MSKLRAHRSYRNLPYLGRVHCGVMLHAILQCTHGMWAIEIANGGLRDKNIATQIKRLGKCDGKGWLAKGKSWRIWNKWKSADEGTDGQIGALQVQGTEQCRLSQKRCCSIITSLISKVLLAQPPSSFIVDFFFHFIPLYSSGTSCLLASTNLLLMIYAP